MCPQKNETGCTSNEARTNSGNRGTEELADQSNKLLLNSAPVQASFSRLPNHSPERKIRT